MINKSCIVVAIALLTALSPLACATEPAKESGDRAVIETFTRKLLRAFEDLDMHSIDARGNRRFVISPQE